MSAFDRNAAKGGTGPSLQANIGYLQIPEIQPRFASSSVYIQGCDDVRINAKAAVALARGPIPWENPEPIRGHTQVNVHRVILAPGLIVNAASAAGLHKIFRAGASGERQAASTMAQAEADLLNAVNRDAYLFCFRHTPSEDRTP